MRDTKESGEGKRGPVSVSEPEVSNIYRVGHLTIDSASQSIKLRGETPRLTSREFQVLHILANANGCVVAPSELVELVWGVGGADREQYLRVFMGRLRAKIQDDLVNPKILVRERGAGYRLGRSGPPDIV